MKKTIFILSIFIIMSCTNNTNSLNTLALNNVTKEQNKLKRYDVKSGIAKYKITVNGKVMGTTINGNGTENLYFKNWGAIELVEEKSTKTTKMKFFGKEKIETTKTHTISKLDNGKSYHVDFDNEIIYLRRDMAMDLFMQTNNDVDKAGENMLKSVGGKKVGTEIIKGYNCEVWNINGAKQWIYKGVVLKLKITVMGITTIKEIITADFNTIIADHHLKLPNFKIKKEEDFLNNKEYQDEMDEMNMNMDKLSNMSFIQWKKLALADKEDTEMQSMSETELRHTYDMMQKMIKMRKGN